MSRVIALVLVCALVALGVAAGWWAFLWLRDAIGPLFDLTVPVSLGGLVASQLLCVVLGAFWRGQR